MAFEINSNSIQDPTHWEPHGIAEVGTFANGAPCQQGYESGTAVWAAMTQSAYATLYTQWNSNKGVLTAGKIPPNTGALGTYRSISAFFHEPRGTGKAGEMRTNVRMLVTFIQ